MIKDGKLRCPICGGDRIRLEGSEAACACGHRWEA